MNEETLTKIANLMEENNVSYRDIERETGIKKSTLQRYIAQGSGKIHLEDIEKLAVVLHTTSAYLMGWDDKKEPTPEDDQLLLDLFHKVPEDKREIVLAMIKAAIKGK